MGRSSMIFHISIAFTSVFNSIQVGSAGVYHDDSKAQTKHWQLVVATSTTLRLIDATTRDLKKILIATRSIDRFIYEEEPLLSKFKVAKYRGNEGDFDRVLRQHPMRGGQYSWTFNNCQHFVACFLMLLHALANGDEQKSFEGNALYWRIIDDVLFKDETFVWNRPNLYVGMTRWTPALLWPAAVAADTAAGATITTVIPAAGIMGWLGAAPTITTVAAPYAAAAATAATALSFGMVAGAGGMAAFYYKRRSWKERTKMKAPLESGFPRGDKPPLSASELF